MKRVQQTILEDRGDGDGRVGNCLQAAVASLLDLELSEVPHFSAQGTDDDGEWWTALRSWARQQGIDFSWVDDLGAVEWRGDRSSALAIATGPSPRGPYNHVVIVDANGALVWDPHPSGEGLAGPPMAFHVVTPPYDPGPGKASPRSRKKKGAALPSAGG